jgi:hypothetical protein
VEREPDPPRALVAVRLTPEWHTSRMTIQCSRHQRDLYEDTRSGEPMGRYLCPEPGCTSILAADQIASFADQAWASANGMTAPGWDTLTPGIKDVAG